MQILMMVYPGKEKIRFIKSFFIEMSSGCYISITRNIFLMLTGTGFNREVLLSFTENELFELYMDN
jgi:hypothetical protein